MRDLYLYILKIDDNVVCISHTLENIHSYISQFETYFVDHSSYEIDSIRNGFRETEIMNKYSNVYLYHLNDEIVLTDLEITYYSNLFREMYMNEKTLVSQMLLNNSIMNFTMEERIMNTKTFDMMYAKMKTYESFLNSLDTSVIFEKYIVNPWIAYSETEWLENSKNRWKL